MKTIYTILKSYLTCLGSKNLYFALAVFFFYLLPAGSLAQTVVTPPTNGQNICNILAVGGSAPAFTTLNTITVSEQNNYDFPFGSSNTILVLTINAPAGWQFNTASPPSFVSPNGRDINNSGVSINTFSSTALSINIAGKNTSKSDFFQINNLQVQALSNASASGNITATAPNSFVIPTSTSFALLSLTTAVTPAVTISASPGSTICVGTSVNFVLTPTNGGTTPIYSWRKNGVQVSTASTYSSTGLADNDKIDVVMTSNLGCLTSPTATSNLITMQVDQVANITSHPSTTLQTVCQGGSVTSLFVSATGSNSFTYQWYSNNSNSNSGGTSISGATTNTYTPPTTTPGTKYYYVAVNDACGTKTSNASGAIKVNAPPTITTNPSPSSQTLCSNSNATFSVAATTANAPLSYAWYKNTTPLADGGKVSGATTATLNLTTLNESFTDNYHVEVSDVNGCPSVSTNVSLTINHDVNITTQPPPLTTVCVGATDVTLNASGTGTGPFTVQWYKAGVVLNTSADYTVTTSDVNTSPVTTSLLIKLANAGDASSNYYVVITGASGTCPAEPSNAAQLVVGTLPTITLTSSTGTDAQTVCVGTTIQAIEYTIANGATGVSISPAVPTGIATSYVGGVFTITGTPTSAASYSYTITATGGCGNTTKTGSLTSNSKSTNPTTASASSPTICIGGSSLLTLTNGGGGTGTIVKWYTSSCGENLVGTGNGLSVSPTITTTYYGRYEDPGPCNNITTCASVIVTVNLAPTATAGTPIVTCSDPAQTVAGSNGVDIFTGSSATNYTNVVWTSSGGGTITNPNSLIAAYYTPTTGERSSGATITLTLIASNSPCAVATSSKTFTITPSINTTDANSWTQAASCLGQGVIFTLPAPPAGGNGSFIYQWMHKNNCGVAGTSNPVLGANGLSFVPPDGDCYWLFITSGGCLVPPTLVSTTTRLKVDTALAATSNVTFSTGSTPNLCIGSSIQLTASSAVSYTYAWSPSTALSATTGSTVTANPTDTITYTVRATATDGSGCFKDAPVTVNVNPLTVPGTLPLVSLCNSNPGGNITLSGYVGSLQWETSTDYGTTWTPVSPLNPSNIQNYPASSTTTLYRVLVKSGVCPSSYSNIDTIGVRNMWTGATGVDWFTARNWSDLKIPTASVIPCPTVIIPSVTSSQYPIITTGTAAVNNIIINANAAVTINGGTMQIAGSISNSGTFDVRNGAIELNGSSGTQSIPVNVFYTNKIKDLIISNNVTLDGIDSLTGTLSFGLTSMNFDTKDNLTLKSTAAGTATVDPVTNGNSITGAVTVERYFSARRAWRYLSVPTNTIQTVKEAWQENAASSGINLAPGYGTQVTDSTPTWLADKFDYYSPMGPSVKQYVPGTVGTYVGIPNTTPFKIATDGGWMTFVRGDRTAIGLYATPTPTILRTKGTLYSGDRPSITVLADRFAGIGNPYASPLDMKNVFKTGVDDFFYLWDPNLTGNGFGAFQTFYRGGDGNFYVAIPGGSYPSATTPYYIQSGQAFFVHSIAGGSVTLKESAKAGAAAASGPLVFRPASASATQAELRTKLYAVESDGSAALVDGILEQFADNFSNAVDGSDAKKMTNLYENLAIKTGSQLLVIERRHTVNENDTLQLNMKKMKVKSYRFEFTGQNFDPALTAFLEDHYHNARTLLNINGTSTYFFDVVNLPGSYDSARFRIVFASVAEGPLPITFSTVKAFQQNKDIAVEWKVENEKNMKQYEVEKSAEGQHFTLTTIAAPKSNNSNSANYQWLDINPFEGANYYRIKSITVNGAIQYSNIVKVVTGRGIPQIIVYPNPVSTGGSINLQLINQPKGRYAIRLIDKLGQVIMAKQIERAEGSSSEALQMNKVLAHGAYQLEVTKPDNSKVNIKILY